MPLNIKEDVYIVSYNDTGEVKEHKNESIYLVIRDGDNSENDHHEQDLKKLPFKERIYFRSFYYKVDAKRTPNGRFNETIAYRIGGGRIL